MDDDKLRRVEEPTCVQSVDGNKIAQIISAETDIEPNEQTTLRRRFLELGIVLREFSTHPVQVAKALPGEWRQRLGKAPWTESDFDEAWYEHLHGLLGAPWPCPEAQQLRGLLADISELLSAKGLGTGRHTYGWYSDDYLLVSKGASELYIMPVTGGQPLKVGARGFVQAERRFP